MIYSINQQIDKRNADIFYLDVVSKDFRALKFQILFWNNGNDIYDNIRNLAFPGIYTDSWFASKYCSSFSKTMIDSSINEEFIDYNKRSLTIHEQNCLYFKDEVFPENGWDVYIFKNEYQRQGVSRSKFK